MGVDTHEKFIYVWTTYLAIVVSLLKMNSLNVTF